MKVSDAHLHFGDWREMKHITETSPLREVFPCYNARNIQFDEMENLETLFDRHHVVNSVVLPSVFREHDPAAENARCIEFAGKSDGYYPFCLLDSSNLEFVPGHYREIAGAKEHIVLHKSELSPQRLEAYAQLAAYGLTLVLHSSARNRAAYVGEILSNFPRLKIQIAHMGRGGIHDTELILNTMEAMKGHETVTFDTSTIRDPGVLNKSVGIIGSDRILYGSDFPFSMADGADEDIMEEQINHVLRAKLSSGECEKILYSNFLHWIKKGKDNG